MKLKLLPLILFGFAVAAHAGDSLSLPAEKLWERRFYIGVSAGDEAGNGMRLGASIGRHGLETGLGMTYSGETGRLNYSYGLRYLCTLYEGAYLWTGGGIRGHREGSDREHLRSGGAGLGVSWHLGSMFRLMLDSGWRVYSDSEIADGDIQINPTVNAGVVYIW